MPFGRCPVCGASYHMNVGLPVDQWYRRYFPGVPFGAEVPGKCIRCWVPLRVGHQVIVRAVPEPLAGAVAVGASGVVTVVEPGAEPMFVVEMAGVTVVGQFHRNELFWVPGQPPVPEAPDAEQGAAADGGE
jgi:hypothetical protein